MLAIFKTGGKQYTAKAGQKIEVEKLDGKKGDNISFSNILAISDSSSHTIGNPTIHGASIEAKILDQIRSKKVIVFKKRKRQNYRHTQGHRQYKTILQIESISLDGKKTKLIKKETQTKKGTNVKQTKKVSTPKKKTLTKKKVVKDKPKQISSKKKNKSTKEKN